MFNKKIVVDHLIVGSGTASLLLAVKLIREGANIALVNPQTEFSSADLLCDDGLALWKAAYKGQVDGGLGHLWDVLRKRLEEALPFAMERAQLTKSEHWSALSSTPIHANHTSALEAEFFRLERKVWALNQVRLVGPEFIDAKLKPYGLRPSAVASLEGAMIRQCAIHWNAQGMLDSLLEFISNKKNDLNFPLLLDAPIRGRHGRRVDVVNQGSEITIEYKESMQICLSGDLLPHIVPLTKSDADWISGVRRRRREVHFLNYRFEYFPRHKPSVADKVLPIQPIWFSLGPTQHFCHDQYSGYASWRAKSGPDGLDTVIDETLRMDAGFVAGQGEEHQMGAQFAVNVHKQYPMYMVVSDEQRFFRLEWEWKTAQWKQTEFQTHWVTAFEGDLWAILDMIEHHPVKI